MNKLLKDRGIGDLLNIIAFAAGIVIAAVLSVIIVLVMRGRSSKNNVKESV